MSNWPAWIAVDWGTTNLRAWAMGAHGKPLAQRLSAKGMGTLKPADFEPALLDLVDELLPPDGTVPVLVCGMAGARQGWIEAPYVEVPGPPPGAALATRAPTRDPRLEVRILPGMMQTQPPDVMRGEETQIAGFLAAEPGFTGTLCLPGTHTKWVAMEDGRVLRFRTCMTGELFALLAGSSVLRHGLSEEELDANAFAGAVMEITRAPQALLPELFGIRAGGLVAGLSPAAARGRLSGLLIGAELAAIAAEFDLADTVLLGSDAMGRAYASALESLGREARLLDADTITLEGLVLAYSADPKGTE